MLVVAEIVKAFVEERKRAKAHCAESSYFQIPSRTASCNAASCQSRIVVAVVVDEKTAEAVHQQIAGLVLALS